VDRYSRRQRSEIMSAVRKTDTAPEMRVRRLLHRLGFRFRLHRRDLPGKPDVVLPKHRTAVFVHGCFWHCHDCPKGTLKPATNRRFWAKKLADNLARDTRNRMALEARGWRVLVIWECETRNTEVTQRKLLEHLLQPGTTGRSKASRGRGG
jgi:DNA mismatch endonuclease (patch repair protein)